MNKVTGGTLPAAAWRNFMLAASVGMPPRPLFEAATAPTPAEESPLDRLLGWLGVAAPPPTGAR
jgi:hypothetical protein